MNTLSKPWLLDAYLEGAREEGKNNATPQTSLRPDTLPNSSLDSLNKKSDDPNLDASALYWIEGKGKRVQILQFKSMSNSQPPSYTLEISDSRHYILASLSPKCIGACANAFPDRPITFMSGGVMSLQRFAFLTHSPNSSALFSSSKGSRNYLNVTLTIDSFKWLGGDGGFAIGNPELFDVALRKMSGQSQPSLFSDLQSILKSDNKELVNQIERNDEKVQNIPSHWNSQMTLTDADLCIPVRQVDALAKIVPTPREDGTSFFMKKIEVQSPEYELLSSLSEDNPAEQPSPLSSPKAFSPTPQTQCLGFEILDSSDSEDETCSTSSMIHGSTNNAISDPTNIIEHHKEATASSRIDVADARQDSLPFTDAHSTQSSHVDYEKLIYEDCLSDSFFWNTLSNANNTSNGLPSGFVNETSSHEITGQSFGGANEALVDLSTFPDEPEYFSSTPTATTDEVNGSIDIASADEIVSPAGFYGYVASVISGLINGIVSPLQGRSSPSSPYADKSRVLKDDINASNGNQHNDESLSAINEVNSQEPLVSLDFHTANPHSTKPSSTSIATPQLSDLFQQFTAAMEPKTGTEMAIDESSIVSSIPESTESLVNPVLITSQTSLQLSSPAVPISPTRFLRSDSPAPSTGGHREVVLKRRRHRNHPLAIPAPDGVEVANETISRVHVCHNTGVPFDLISNATNNVDDSTMDGDEEDEASISLTPILKRRRQTMLDVLLPTPTLRDNVASLIGGGLSKKSKASSRSTLSNGEILNAGWSGPFGSIPPLRNARPVKYVPVKEYRKRNQVPKLDLSMWP